ncbi:hypothetical protein [Deinococcus sonorensis]|uniref:Uncharacterized protein n=2 Tax=Deinococcus sonorensis TaxID=309891 RepID=A0AAU7UE81_9DEIO
MASQYQFICPSCRYEAVICGGRDSLMSGEALVTIECFRCRELTDARPLWNPGWMGMEDASWWELALEQVQARLSWLIPPRCSTNPWHLTRRWRMNWARKGRCPRCRTWMEAGAVMRILD